MRRRWQVIADLGLEAFPLRETSPCTCVRYAWCRAEEGERSRGGTWRVLHHTQPTFRQPSLHNIPKQVMLFVYFCILTCWPALDTLLEMIGAISNFERYCLGNQLERIARAENIDNWSGSILFFYNWREQQRLREQCTRQIRNIERANLRVSTTTADWAN